jgi:FHS family Na+ dependent glucose MFS transporter 1
MNRLDKSTGYYATYVALGLVTASLGPTLPGLAENTGTSLGTSGLLFTARSLGFTLGSLYGGRAYDRYYGHRVMTGVLLLMAITLALVPLTTIFWLLAGVMLILGLGEGSLDVGGNTLLVWLKGERVGSYMNAMHFFFGAGAFLSPIIIAQVLDMSGDITWAYWALAVLVAPVAIWLARVPSPSPPTRSSKEIHRGNSPHLVFLVAAFFFLYVGAEASFGGWVFTYARQVNFGGQSIPEITAAYLTSAFWGALTLGRLAGIPLAARLRPSRILALNLVGCLASLATLLLWPRSSFILWLGTIGLGLFMASIFPTTFTFAERRMPISGQVTGLFFVGVGAGGMSLPWLVGRLFEAIGPHALPIVLAGDLIVGLGVLASLIGVTSGDSYP